MDTSTVNELIPQMFDQMRSNMGTNNSKRINNSVPLTQAGSPSSAITTQSLLKELEALDKIIPMIETVDDALQKALPSHLNRIHEICKSTNAMLDSWINIQSQAGYIHRLMSSEAYLRTTSQSSSEDIPRAEEVIAAEVREIEKLKQAIVEEEENRNGRDHANTMTSAIRKIPNSSRNARGGIKRGAAIRSRLNRPSGIPSVSSRLARPTASSSRKMFR